jgi:hypothetical protein
VSKNDIFEAPQLRGFLIKEVFLDKLIVVLVYNDPDEKSLKRNFK